MKKAEEWDMTHPGDSAIEFIEKIQQDAFRAGMLRAAGIAYKADANDSPSHVSPQQAILTAANNLKPEDLK